MSGVCRLSELLVSPGYREEEGGGREREGGTLPPPVAIHYNCRGWRSVCGQDTEDATRDNDKRVLSQHQLLSGVFEQGNHTKDVCGIKFAQTKRTEATTDHSCDAHLAQLHLFTTIHRQSGGFPARATEKAGRAARLDCFLSNNSAQPAIGESCTRSLATATSVVLSD